MQLSTTNDWQRISHLTYGTWRADNGKYKVELTYRYAPSKKIIHSSLIFIDYSGQKIGYHDGCLTWNEDLQKIIFWDFDEKDGKLIQGEAWIEGRDFIHQSFLPDGKSYLSKFIMLEENKMELVFLTDPEGNEWPSNSIIYSRLK